MEGRIFLKISWEAPIRAAMLNVNFLQLYIDVIVDTFTPSPCATNAINIDEVIFMKLCT